KKPPGSPELAGREPARHPVTPGRQFLAAPRRTGTAGLPDPLRLSRHLALAAIEVVEGLRPLEQLSAWISGPVARALAVRRELREQRRVVYGDTRRAPHALGRARVTHPCDGIVEAVVVVHSKARSLAVTVRLESIDHRWRATDLTVL
ncbi:Rv3235 family protein, partial [Leucobacter sp. M11]|uniref:Rv3235 family protein n=1 Tax=Leucobacter sp. M11 TaxID=2993565 RepID=UPI002D7EE8FF